MVIGMTRGDRVVAVRGKTTYDSDINQSNGSFGEQTEKKTIKIGRWENISLACAHLVNAGIAAPASVRFHYIISGTNGTHDCVSERFNISNLSPSTRVTKMKRVGCVDERTTANTCKSRETGDAQLMACLRVIK